jgi:hypothetical protein
MLFKKDTWLIDKSCVLLVVRNRDFNKQVEFLTDTIMSHTAIRRPFKDAV